MSDVRVNTDEGSCKGDFIGQYECSVAGKTDAMNVTRSIITTKSMNIDVTDYGCILTSAYSPYSDSKWPLATLDLVIFFCRIFYINAMSHSVSILDS